MDVFYCTKFLFSLYKDQLLPSEAILEATSDPNTTQMLGQTPWSGQTLQGHWTTAHCATVLPGILLIGVPSAPGRSWGYTSSPLQCLEQCLEVLRVVDMHKSPLGQGARHRQGWVASGMAAVTMKNSQGLLIIHCLPTVWQQPSHISYLLTSLIQSALNSSSVMGMTVLTPIAIFRIKRAGGKWPEDVDNHE